MSLVKPPSGGWCNLRNDILCECGLNGRSRMCYQAIMTRRAVGAMDMF